MLSDWKKITVQDVEKAIQLFDNDTEHHPQARNTFLVFNGKKYPAKHIRAIAYRVAFGLEILKSEFSGGEETARFFTNLGFTIEYTGEVIHPIIAPYKGKKSRLQVGRLLARHHHNGSKNSLLCRQKMLWNKRMRFSLS